MITQLKATKKISKLAIMLSRKKGWMVRTSLLCTALSYLAPDLIEELRYQYNQATLQAEFDPLLWILCFV